MPEMTAVHLLTLFNRAATQEDYATVRMETATYEESESIARLDYLERQQRAYGVKPPDARNQGWKP